MINPIVVFLLIFTLASSFSTSNIHLRESHLATRTYKQACEEVRKGQICGVAFGLGEICCKKQP